MEWLATCSVADQHGTVVVQKFARHRGGCVTCIACRRCITLRSCSETAEACAWQGWGLTHPNCPSTIIVDVVYQYTAQIFKPRCQGPDTFCAGSFAQMAPGTDAHVNHLVSRMSGGDWKLQEHVSLLPRLCVKRCRRHDVLWARLATLLRQ